jgi:amidohydrolase
LHSIDRDQEGTVTAALTNSPDDVLVGCLSEDNLPGDVDSLISFRAPALIDVRRHLHANPEISGREFETTSFIAARLVALGLRPQVMPRGNGLFCDIAGYPSTGDRLVAVRADIDALPIDDPKDVPYRATVSGACHACGHDVHTAVMLGAAEALVRLADLGLLPGRVRLLFQPAEETASGAAQVIEAGGLDGVSSVFALHCAPYIPAGFASIRTGAITAAADLIEVKLTGAGGHTSRPHLTSDLVYALGQIIVSVPALLSRRVDPRAGASLIWGAVHAGKAPNAIPADGSLCGFIRVIDREAWLDLPPIITQLIHDAAAGTDAKVDVIYTRGVPPVVNDHSAAAILRAAAMSAMGADHVLEADVSMGGEDFSFFTEKVPGAMMRLGVGSPSAASKFDLHQAEFDVDESAIEYGTRTMVHAVLNALVAPGLA